jgi:anti-sigma regulatory factor (Ser/Thr protein kinase)
VRARFAADLHAPSQARSFVTQRLSGIEGDAWSPSGDDILLIVSELVTNSVRAGAATVDVQVQLGADRVEVQVSDDAAGWPSARVADAEDLGGRGLSIVEALADRVRTTAHRPGKTVTATWFRAFG